MAVELKSTTCFFLSVMKEVKKDIFSNKALCLVASEDTNFYGTGAQWKPSGGVE